MLFSWNETVANNYYKFLDYQWESNKSEGRKSFTTQQLVIEIDALWHEQQLQTALKQQRERSQQSLNDTPIPESRHPSRPLLSLPPPQLAYTFGDTSIIYDICDLMLLSSCEQRMYNPKDTTTMQRFITDFIPPLFGLPPRANFSTDSRSANIRSTAIHTTKASAQTRWQQQRKNHPKNRDKKQPPEQHIRVETRLFIGNEHWYCMIRYFQVISVTLSASCRINLISFPFLDDIRLFGPYPVHRLAVPQGASGNKTQVCGIGGSGEEIPFAGFR
jgi:histone deacetylase complex regulatory component SIN3